MFYDRLILYFDGACRNNPHGPAGCGWVVYEMDQHGAVGDMVAQGSDYLAYNVSNNQAEYQGLINGLEYIDDNLACDTIYIRGDAEIVIRQMNGVYQVRSSNIQPYYNSVQKLLQCIQCNEYSFRHVSRDRNWKADQLANEAIDQNQHY